MSQIAYLSSGGNVGPISGQVTTVGAVTADPIVINLGSVAGTYCIEARIAAFNAATPAGGSYQLFGGVRTTGAAGVLIGQPDLVVNEEAALVPCVVDLVVVGNTAIIRVTGVALLTIDWSATAFYTRVT